MGTFVTSLLQVMDLNFQPGTTTSPMVGRPAGNDCATICGTLTLSICNWKPAGSAWPPLLTINCLTSFKVAGMSSFDTVHVTCWPTATSTLPATPTVAPVASSVQ